ncbi:MAG TPA: cupin domain-containing protein [Dehalococcoidia bacterium]|jgi:putative monooxygenase|nr:cupin domain-containing protein [Dehalococcoidia bacterium]
MAILRLADMITSESAPGIVGRRIGGPNSGATQITSGLNTLAPGAIITYHSHPDAEIMHYVIEGDVECVLDGHRVSLHAGDGALAPVNVKHSFENRSGAPAKFITAGTTIGAIREDQDLDPPSHDPLPRYVVFAEDVVPTYPWPGTERFDPMDASFGSSTLLFSKGVIAPGSLGPPHFHPETEEFMYCLEGELMAMYNGEEFPLHAGDMLLAEPGTHHAIFNASNDMATLIAIHPTTAPVRELVDWTPSQPLPTIPAN